MDRRKWLSGGFAESFLCCALLTLLAAGSCDSRAAEQSASRRDREVLKLRDDVEQLKTQQQKILDALNDLQRGNNKSIAAQGDIQSGISLPLTLNLARETFEGAASAQVVIIEYGDFECPFCRRFVHETYPQIRDTYINTGQVRYYFLDLPLQTHALAMPAARAAHCAAEQGQYWPMHDSLFADNLVETGDIDKRAAKLGLDVVKFNECTASERFADDISHSVARAKIIGIRGTPTFLIGSVSPGEGNVTITKAIVGAEALDAFKAVLDPLLATKTPSVGADEAKLVSKQQPAL